MMFFSEFFFSELAKLTVKMRQMAAITQLLCNFKHISASQTQTDRHVYCVFIECKTGNHK